MRDLRRDFKQPEAADFNGGAFLPNGWAFVFDHNGEVVILRAWHINRNATADEIARKDFSICPMRKGAHKGEAVDNADFIVYELDDDLLGYVMNKTVGFCGKALKALTEAGLIQTLKVGK